MKKQLIFMATVLLLILSGKSFAQSETTDSVIKKANSEIYINTDNAIKTAKKLLETEKDIKQQIRIYLLISTANFAKRNFEESLKYTTKATDLSKKIDDIKTQITVLFTIAN